MHRHTASHALHSHPAQAGERVLPGYASLARTAPVPDNAAQKEPSGAEAQWALSTPIPFDSQHAPAIPADILPGIIAEYAAAVAESVQVPFEVPLVNALGAVAATVQRKFRVQMHVGYSEPLNIFALASLAPGERKSAAKDACRFPLLEWEEEQKRRVAQEIKQAQAEQQVQEEAARSLLVTARKCRSAEERRTLAQQLTNLKEESQPLPVPPRLLADDTTPEALAALMAQHGQRITMMEAEGGFFDTLGGRYSNGVPNLDAVLKSWSGEAIRIDRRHADPILLDNPTLTLILSAQPDVLRGAALTPSFRGRGLLGRLLFFIPQSRVGRRIIETTPIPEGVKNQYSATLLHLLRLPWNTDAQGENARIFSPWKTRQKPCGSILPLRLSAPWPMVPAWPAYGIGAASCRGRYCVWRVYAM